MGPRFTCGRGARSGSAELRRAGRGEAWLGGWDAAGAAAGPSRACRTPS
eukprot:CAMPEP_0185521014 /NCGR_PEP_ID=MMETSP1366-20130426/78946_1 /TAXON_ID=38817 /ORGANISM="Gephyrocapsa oceanica, Strain RCC1303" /LENGTH=48 /DNA_ID= /DNA_START= /DNA_END= /DNA_ORIENTATION=